VSAGCYNWYSDDSEVMLLTEASQAAMGVARVESYPEPATLISKCLQK